MEQKAGAQISTKAFVQSLAILFVLMMAAGMLTRVVPAGQYAQTLQEGREIIFGIFEEVVPLVPVMIALAYFLGWDSLVGLGMSILATNVGFSAAVTNPFSIGVAQKIAGLPLFSGAGLRVLIFFTMYGVFAVFLVRYARSVERNPQSSPVFEEDHAGRARYQALQLDSLPQESPRLGRALGWFLAFIFLILLVLVGGPFLPAVSQFSLPLVGLLFLIGGVGAGLVSERCPSSSRWRTWSA
jgi:uncharacterized ion transporter superfamily protein YfcC